MCKRLFQKPICFLDLAQPASRNAGKDSEREQLLVGLESLALVGTDIHPC